METNNKLREALTKILDLTNSLDEDCAVDPVEIRDIAKAALAAPPRNCDKYSHDEALQVWASEKENEHNGCFDEWLYEIAKEGGAK